jgi:chromosome segregation ATPase
MAGTAPRDAISPEMIDWLQGQVRDLADQQTAALSHLEQLRRQVHSIAEQVIQAERSLREIDPKFIPFQGVPGKLREIEESHEHLRQEITSNRSEVENALRVAAAESQYDREERAELSRRFEQAVQQLGVIAADTARVQTQAIQFTQTMQTITERQRQVEELGQHLATRVDRITEVNHDMEARLVREFKEHQDERFEVVFERLQVVGEMVRRNEEVIQAIAAERSTREDLLQEVGVLRDHQSRIETRLIVVEELGEKLLTEIDKAQADITLLDGRHQGLGERVATIRRDIAEVVDHVREEFTKYSKMQEKQRRAQIQVLEQELREMKFHSFHPPEEP